MAMFNPNPFYISYVFILFHHFLIVTSSLFFFSLIFARAKFLIATLLDMFPG